MKLSFAVLFAAIAGVAAKKRKTVKVAQDGLKADSPLGQKILSQARRVEENDEYSMTWVEGFSLKFQGCHHIQQWNDEADGEEDVRISTKRLIRFRLCPSDTCSATSAGGCSADYGEYVIDLNTFMDSYFEVTRQITEYDCEYYLENNCACEDDDGKGDDFDEEICQYDCMNDAGLAETCQINNPYNDDEQQEDQFMADEYMECQEFQFEDNNQRKLDQEEEEQFFIGPYCSEQGGAVFLGLFTDDSCSTFADAYGGKETYLSKTGDALPYSEVSLISPDCVSCYNKQEAANNDGNDNNNGESYVMEQCEAIYSAAGKCESTLPEGTARYPNEAACNYIAGVKVIRQDGMIFASNKGSSAATAFIVIFAVACAGLGYYVYLLRTKLQKKADPLL